MRQILKFHTTGSIATKFFFQHDRDHQVLFIGGPNMPQTNPMAIIKKFENHNIT